LLVQDGGREHGRVHDEFGDHREQSLRSEFGRRHDQDVMARHGTPATRGRGRPSTTCPTDAARRRTLFELRGRAKQPATSRAATRRASRTRRGRRGTCPRPAYESPAPTGRNLLSRTVVRLRCSRKRNVGPQGGGPRCVERHTGGILSVPGWVPKRGSRTGPGFLFSPPGRIGYSDASCRSRALTPRPPPRASASEVAFARRITLKEE
jgi:hypothetical protein